jgi:hypothetical protein
MSPKIFVSSDVSGMEADKPHNCPCPSAGQLMIQKLFYICKKKSKKIVILSDQYHKQLHWPMSR